MANKALNDTLGIKRANFVTLAHGLEERGLIERRAASGDRRANALHLTEAGRSFLSQARGTHEAMENELIERLGGTAARETLLKLLDRLS